MLTDQKTIIEPNNIPHVAIDFMNHTHYEEVELVKKVGLCIEQYQSNKNSDDTDKRAISKILQQWYKHTVAHFSRENELMKDYDFPAYEVHSIEHEIALERMDHVIKAWETNQDIDLVADFIFSLWPAWFDAHVNSMDMVTAKYAVMHGYSNNQLKAS